MLAQLGRFRHDTDGNVAVMMGIGAIALIGMVGAAFDYSRAASAQSNLQRGVDAAALLAARNRETATNSGWSDAAATQLMRTSFDVKAFDDLLVKVTVNGDRVRVDASGSVKTTLSNVFGLRSLPVNGSAEATFGDTRIEIALVLDNTGSMAQLGKLDMLKKAANNFVTKMQSNVGNPGALKIALVPFDTNVNLGNLKNSSWINPVSTLYWLTHPAQAGCVWDRDQPNDAKDVAPIFGDPSTTFSADTSRTRACSLGEIVPLTTDFGALHTAIDSMTPSGNTNVTIGLAWGYHVLTPAEPVTNALPLGTKNLRKYIIFMTDGLNTQNRWTTDPVAIDSRARQVCDSIRATEIAVFTARIIEGNADLLRGCASDPSMYYDVQAVEQLNPVFDSIFNQIIGSRLAR